MIISENKERFLSIYDTYIKRAGADKLIEWMDNRTDFFTAPASTRFHGLWREAVVGDFTLKTQVAVWIIYHLQSSLLSYHIL